MKFWAVVAARVLTVITIFAVTASFLYYWEPTRIVWKVWTAKSPYLYEQINPRFLKTDPARLIRIRTPGDAKRMRAALIETIWGPAGLPLGERPRKIERDIALVTTDRLAATGLPFGEFAGMDNLAGIDRLRISVADFYDAAVYHLRPAKPNGKLVLYQNGHGRRATFMDQMPLIASLIGDGYDVLAFNLVTRGDSRLKEVYLPHYGWYYLHNWRLLDLVDRPLRFHLGPVIVALNHTLETRKFSRVDMIGFSAGGWVTVLASAVDRRIQGSYTVAGPYPIYLRSGEEEQQAARPQYYRPLLETPNYLEMFVLAALDKGQRQMQIFNRYDACCFNNTKGKLYESAVQDVVARCCRGRFDVVVDETHTRHAISPFAIATIRRDMARRDRAQSDKGG